MADFSGDDSLVDSIRRLQSNGSEPLLGNKAFFAADYMVHRREKFIITNKLVSNRTIQTEALNGANAFGYHMGLGHLLSYVTGNEYKDIMNAWDWNLVPGTTTLLNRPALDMKTVATTGRTTFVGSVSDGWVGTSVMDFVEPKECNLRFRKAWFFLDDSVIVVTEDIATNSSAPVITVLDQRASSNDSAAVDGQVVELSNTSRSIAGYTLYYGGNGYLSYDEPFNLTLAEGNYTGNWSAISTSALGVQSASIFSAYTTLSGTSHAYAFFPASDSYRLEQETRNPSSSVISGRGITGVAGVERLSLVFWPEGDRSTTIDLDSIGWARKGSITVDTSAPIALLFATRSNGMDRSTMVITVSDPSQSLSSVQLDLQFRESGSFKPLESARQVQFHVDLPQGGLAGSSVFLELELET